MLIKKSCEGYFNGTPHLVIFFLLSTVAEVIWVLELKSTPCIYMKKNIRERAVLKYSTAMYL